MKIRSNNILDGYIDPQFGARGDAFRNGQRPNRSIHIAWEDLPKGTQSLALVLQDYDAIPPWGFSWIHWVVANIDPSLGELPENASLEMPLLQGSTSWSSKAMPDAKRLTPEESAYFGGFMPPDKPHRYTIEIYALDTKLNLKTGFFANELIWAMEGHTLDKAVITAIYNN